MERSVAVRPSALFDLDDFEDRFAGPACGVQLDKLARPGTAGVEQPGDQAEQFRCLLGGAVRPMVTVVTVYAMTRTGILPTAAATGARWRRRW
ncbi:hypothetical protein ACFYR1_27420 [Streptomyces canus]|uniref:hypothetical protein n=1 Tax=Streptomyces canus TaxID=58343 RepID=UPI0036A06D8C